MPIPGDLEGQVRNIESEREMLIRAPAHVHSARAALCCWSKLAAHSRLALQTGFDRPCLVSCSTYVGSNSLFDFDQYVVPARYIRCAIPLESSPAKFGPKIKQET